MKKCKYCKVKIKEIHPEGICMTCEIVLNALCAIVSAADKFSNKKSLRYWDNEISNIILNIPD